MANLIPVNKSPISKKINSDSFFGKKTKIGKSESVKAKTKGSSLKNEFILIRKKVIKIDKLLNAFIKFQKKNQEGTRREKELGKRSDRESKLEKKKDKAGAISFPSLPVGGNFLESIKRFLFFTFLNIALPKLLELLPKLRELGKAIAPATKFLLDIAGGVGKGLLSGLVNFIDWGYKIRDNTEKTIKQIGGDKAAKDFNEFNKRLNTFIDLSILAGLTALDVGLDAERFRKKQLKDQQKAKGRKPQVTEGRGGQKPIGRPKVTTGAGGKAGAGPVTQGRGGKPLGKFSKFKSGPFAKFAGPIGKFLGAATPFLGAGIGAADAAARFSSGDKVGGALASASSALDAFSGVAAITGVGLPLAGIATGISIGIDIVLLVRDLIKVMLPGVPMFRNGGRIRLFAQGGRIGTPGRTIKAQRKTLGARPSAKPEIKPGKDVGGKNQILKLFPDPSSENKQQTISASPWWERLLGSGQNQSQSSRKAPNPYKALKGTAEILGKIPGDIGRLMSAGAAIPLGQKPDRDIGRGFGSFVGKITQDIIDNNVNLSFGDIMKSISGFANGGDIRNQNIMKNNDIGYQVGQVVEKAIGSMISSKVNEAVSSIQREIASIGKPPEESLTGNDYGNGDGDGGGGGTSGQFTGTAADIPPEGKALLDAIAGSESGGYHSRYPSKTFDNNWVDHPRISERILSGPNKGKRSDAAGRYQFLSSTWDDYKPAKAFTPENQDIAAWKLAIAAYGQGEQGIIKDLKQDPLKVSNKLSGTWTSLPGGIEPNNATNGFLSRFKSSVKKYNNLSGQSLTTKGVKKFTRADITSLFGSQESFRKKPHEGMDIAANQGTPISFDMGGKILGVYRTNSGAREANGGYGSYMDIKFSDGKIARMAHLSNIPQSIKNGITFKANQIIAYSGGEEGSPGAGRSGGPHIHLEQLSKPMGIQETTKGKYDPLRGGLFQRIQKGGTLISSSLSPSSNSQSSIEPVSLAPTQKKSSSESLAFNPSYSQEGQSGFLAIQQLNHYTFIQQA